MRPKEFWSEEITKSSWKKLTEISKEFEFILIGGWAVYLWTKAHKSKDIDLVIDYTNLKKLAQKYDLQKNERLKKYEIKMERFDIDVYVPHYSKLAVPVAQLKNYTTRVEGITTVTPEILVVLKQGAEMDRRESLKGRKDRIDILTLLFHSPFQLPKYRQLLKELQLTKCEYALQQEIRMFDPKESEYLGLNLKEFVNWKKNFLKVF